MSEPTLPGARPLVLTQDELVKLLSQQSEAANALVIAGLIDDEMQKLLLTAMRELSNKMAARLFDGYGPLKDFAAKIDVAFAFDLIDDQTHADLRVIKDIRNKFAHAIRFTFFTSPEIVKLCQKLSTYKEGDDCQTVYRTRALDCINGIQASADSRIFAAAMDDAER